MAFLFLFFTVALSLCVVGLIVLALSSILAEERCLQSSITRQPVMVQGLTTEGKLLPFSGTVQAVEKGHTRYLDYLRKRSSPMPSR